jgi:hypothetical protein
MKKTALLIGLGLLNLSYGLDEYLSINPGKTEVDVGYQFSKITAVYDQDGKAHDVSDGSSLSANMLPLQVKYGIIPGLDAEFAITGLSTSKDAGDLGGFTNPELALKYTMAELGLGGFVNVILPFVTGNLDKNREPAMGLGLGAVYQNRFGDFRLTGTAGYQLNFENKDKQKSGNFLFLYAKPEAMWTEYIGTYLGLRYQMAGESAYDGKSTKDSDRNLFTVLPGVNAQLLKWLAYEINVPVDLSGKSIGKSWGIGGKVFVTFPMEK